MKKLFLLMATCVSLVMFSGCISVPKKIWYKSGGSHEDFSNAKYPCLKESQQRVSHAERQGAAAVADSQVQTNWVLFEACMNSQGWRLVDENSVGNGSPQPAEAKKEVTPQVQPAKPAAAAPPAAPEIKKEAPKKEAPKKATYEVVVAPEKALFSAKTGANLREGPSIKHKKVGLLKKGDEVDVLASKDGWYQVETPDGTIAWCNKNALEQGKK